MDAVTIGASSNVYIDDSVPVEVKVAGEIPEINWLLIIAEILAGTVTTFAAIA